MLQVVEGKVPEVGGEVGQSQEPPGQRVPEEAGVGAVREQPVLDDLPKRCSQHPGCDLRSWGGGSRGAHLQRGVHDLVDGGEVGIPQELGLLLESQDALRVDAADDGGHLRGLGGGSCFLTLTPQQGYFASLTSVPLQGTILCHLLLCHLAAGQGPPSRALGGY